MKESKKVDLEDLKIIVYRQYGHADEIENMLHMKWEANIGGELHGHRSPIYANTPFKIIRKLEMYAWHIRKYYNNYYEEQQNKGK